MRQRAAVAALSAFLASCGPRLEYPMQAGDISKLLDSDNMAKLRLHAWKVMEMAVKPVTNGEPQFRAWEESSNVFRTAEKAHFQLYLGRTPAVHFTRPRELGARAPYGTEDKVMEQVFSSDCDAIPCQLVYFNPATVDALNHPVTVNGVTLVPKCRNSLDALRASFGTTDIDKRDIPDFPPDSLVVKSVWLIVNSAETRKLPVYDAATVVPATPHANPWAGWKHCVGIKATPDLPDGEAEGCEAFPSIDEFYHFELKGAAEIQDATSEYYLENLPPGSHTYAVLLGMHITTREIPDWVWATFWWGDRSQGKIYSRDRPASLSGNRQWRNYAMDVAYDMNRPEAAAGVPKICFNPFLEGQLASGAVSNCMTCHRRAGLGTGDALQIFRGKIQKDDRTVFDDRNMLRTDFLWSLVFHGTTCAAP